MDHELGRYYEEMGEEEGGGFGEMEGVEVGG